MFFSLSCGGQNIIKLHLKYYFRLISLVGYALFLMINNKNMTHIIGGPIDRLLTTNYLAGCKLIPSVCLFIGILPRLLADPDPWELVDRPVTPKIFRTS